MIRNHSKNSIISQEELVCRSLFSQAGGLMFRQRKNVIMIFPKEQIISLHMFFVFYPIEVLVLNDQRKVIEIKKNFLPFQIWQSKEKGKYCIELGATQSKNKVSVGDIITLSKKKEESKKKFYFFFQ